MEERKAVEKTEILLFARVRQRPQARLAAHVAGAGIVADQANTQLAGRKAHQLQGVGAFYGVGFGPGIGHFFGFLLRKRRQLILRRVQHGPQQLLGFGGGTAERQRQLTRHEEVARHEQRVDERIVAAIDGPHGARRTFRRVRIQNIGPVAARRGGVGGGQPHRFEHQAVEDRLRAVIVPGAFARGLGRALQLDDIETGI